jgi:hypothetical protein
LSAEKERHSSSALGGEITKKSSKAVARRESIKKEMMTAL